MHPLPADLPKHLEKALQEPTHEVRQASDELFIEWKHQKLDLVANTARYWGGVRAVYGPTILLCEELFVDRASKTGRAIGKVRIVDPDGEVQAENLEFNYKTRTGEATHVFLEIEGVKVWAEKLIIGRDAAGNQEWTLLKARMTPSKQTPPEFTVRARDVVLKPGRGGKAHFPGLELWGKSIGAVPYLTFSLDKRVTGFRLPAIAFKRGQGIGFSWGSAFLLSDQMSVTGKLNVLPKSLPSTMLEFAWTPVDPEKYAGKLATRPDLYDRFADGYMDSILVKDRDAEVKSLQMPRKIASAGSYWNLATRGRATDEERISKKIDAAIELGGAAGKGGFLVQARAQSIRPTPAAPFKERLVLTAIGHSGHLKLSDSLSAFTRLDTTWNLGSSGYGWVRGLAGLTYQPSALLELTAAWSEISESGNPMFAFDEPYMKSGAHLRADLDFGSIRAAALVKYDSKRRDWADVEYGVSLAAGSFEPYFTYRQYPREVQFGLRLRAMELFERLSRRRVERKSAGPPEGSPSKENDSPLP